MTLHEMWESYNRKRTYFDIDDYNWKLKSKDLYSVRITCPIINVIEYLDKNFGDTWMWFSPTRADYTDIFFLHECDAVMFKLCNKV